MKKIFNIIIAFTIAVMPIVAIFTVQNPVYALTGNETLTVDGEGFYTQGTYVGGAANFTNMQSDDDGSYLQMTAVGYHDWSFTNGIATWTIVTNVSFNFKLKETYTGGTPAIYPYVRISGVDYLGSSQPVGAYNYRLCSNSWATSPATGLAWTTAEINSATFGVRFSGAIPYGDYLNDTYCYVVVSYTMPELATLNTSAASSVSTTTATLNGSIVTTGDENADFRGFVYGAVSNATMPDAGEVPPATYTTNTTEGGSFGTGAFTKAVIGLTANTTYYFRAYSHNSVGYAYSAESNFHTVGTPSGTTNSATDIGTTTANLKGTITNDNGQACDVRFGWDTVTRANIAAYANKTTWVNNTYTTGSYPSASLSGLTSGTTYYFRIQIENDAGVVEGSELSFVSGGTLSPPTNLVAVSSANSISLSWVKGIASTSTLVRYSTGGFPATTADGTLVYFDTAASTVLTGLTSGTSYYFTAWGYAGGLYSATSTTVLSTTVAIGAATTTNNSVPVMSSWVATPDATKVQNVPVLGFLATWASDQYKQPLAMVWYFCWLACSAAAGILIYAKSNNNMVVSLVSELGIMGLGVAVGLIMLWVVIGILIIALGFIFWGDRR